jgi:hypothetical protein
VANATYDFIDSLIIVTWQSVEGGADGIMGSWEQTIGLKILLLLDYKSVYE